MTIHLIGGFLGAGKTTAIVEACRLLKESGVSVGVVTNDQGEQQVDTHFIRKAGFNVLEVSNGCFCCKYNLLEGAIKTHVSHSKPAVVFAESVGSCTDIIASVVKPLGLHQPSYSAVVSIFVDASFLSSLIEGTSLFIEENVRYIFKKQIEEADLLILNKSDQITPVQRERITAVLNIEYPGKKILFQDARQPGDIRKWLESAEQFSVPLKRNSLEINYDKYADGEAQLAWLDAGVSVKSSRYRAFEIACIISTNFYDKIAALNLTIGHLKFYLETSNFSRKISFTTTGQTDVREGMIESAPECFLVINARVQTKPTLLKEIMDEVLREAASTHECLISINKWKAFQPGYPIPLHRISD